MVKIENFSAQYISWQEHALLALVLGYSVLLLVLIVGIYILEAKWKLKGVKVKVSCVLVGVLVGIAFKSGYGGYVEVQENNRPYVEQMQMQLEGIEGNPLDYNEVRHVCDTLSLSTSPQNYVEYKFSAGVTLKINPTCPDEFSVEILEKE